MLDLEIEGVLESEYTFGKYCHRGGHFWKISESKDIYENVKTFGGEGMFLKSGDILR